MTWIPCSPSASVTADAQPARDWTRRATSVMSARPSSLVPSGATEGSNESRFSKTGEHISSADLFPILEREMAVHYGQSIRCLPVNTPTWRSERNNADGSLDEIGVVFVLFLCVVHTRLHVFDRLLDYDHDFFWTGVECAEAEQVHGAIVTAREQCREDIERLLKGTYIESACGVRGRRLTRYVAPSYRTTAAWMSMMDTG